MYFDYTDVNFNARYNRINKIEYVRVTIYNRTNGINKTYNRINKKYNRINKTHVFLGKQVL